MTDVNKKVGQFEHLFRERLVDLAAQHRGTNRFEAIRWYHTNAKFHAQVETLVLIAAQVVRDLEDALNQGVGEEEVEEVVLEKARTRDGLEERLQQVFSAEVEELLKWSDDKD